MHLKCNKRHKDGKVHRYWSVMESYRLANGKSAKRQVLYLGEINDSQKLAWRKTISVIDNDGKERSMRKRRLKKLWTRLKELSEMKQDRDQLLMRLGAARKEAGRAWYLVEVTVPEAASPVAAETFHYRLKRDKLRTVMKREGRYLLRAFVPETMPAPEIWCQYIGLTEVEESFRNLKGDLGIRPIYHQKEDRLEAYIFVSFLSYCLHVALRGKLRSLAAGLTPRAALEKFASMQMIDVHLPAGETGEVGELVMPRYTRPDKDLALLLERMDLRLPSQPPPTIRKSVGETF